jgi:GNAT superfamily N-acetyltransferase
MKTSAVGSSVEKIRAVLRRRDLENIPQQPLPNGYSFRFYRPGDEETWAQIWSSADDFDVYDSKRFRNIFGTDDDLLARSCLFLVDPEGQEVGTATAWVESYAKLTWAKLSWIAISRSHQGLGLARPLLSAVMNRSKELGHCRAVLYTYAAPIRIRAIRLYLDYGMMPDLSHPDGDRAWKFIAETLGVKL